VPTNKIILVDFSQAVIAACAAQAKELNGNSEAKSYIRHIVLGMILQWKQKFKGKIILACDAKNYWRKDEFPAYKGHRKHENTEFLNWDLVRECVEELKNDLRLYFPYHVIEVEGAEADDVVAILTKFFQENDLVNTGLIEEPREIVIVSTDGDFQQLQKYPGVFQWNNVQKKMIVCANPKQYLIEHLARGDTDDNVPSVCNGDDWAKARKDGVPVRAAPFKTSRLLDFYHKGIDACLNEVERRNWKRNELLIDLDSIPSAINMKVISAYLDYEVKGNKNKVFNYLTKNRMKYLMSSSSEF
jgi:hypothetical protein